MSDYTMNITNNDNDHRNDKHDNTRSNSSGNVLDVLHEPERMKMEFDIDFDDPAPPCGPNDNKC